MGALIWIARINRHDALYDASFAAQTFDEAGQVRLSPIDFEEIADVDLAKSTGDVKFAHIE